MLENAPIIALVGLASTVVGILGRIYYVRRTSQLKLELSDKDELKGIRSELYHELKELRAEYRAQVAQSIECKLKVVFLTEENTRLRARVGELEGEVAELRGGERC